MRASSLRLVLIVGHTLVAALTFAFAVVARTHPFDRQRAATAAAIEAGAAVLSTVLYNPAALWVWRVRKRPNGVDQAKGEVFNVSLLVLYALAVAITSIVHITLPCSENECNTAWSIVTIVLGFIGVITSTTWLCVDLLAVRSAKRRGAEIVWKESMWALMEENEGVGKRYGLETVSSDL